MGQERETIPTGPNLIVEVGQQIEAGQNLTNNPNVGGFGQLDTEVVLQDPWRVIGLIAFFSGIILSQIMLVLKKKQNQQYKTNTLTT